MPLPFFFVRMLMKIPSFSSLFSSTSKPLAVEFCNPLCLKQGPFFEGMCDPQPDQAVSANLCCFLKPSWGFRAAFNIFITYADKYQCSTARALITRIAPRTGDDLEKYITNVCDRIKISPDETINPKCWRDSSHLIYSMTIEELETFNWFRTWQMEDGARRAGIVDVPPTPVHKNLVIVGSTVAGSSEALSQFSTYLSSYSTWFDQTQHPWLHTGFHVLTVACSGLVILAGWLKTQRHGV